MLKKSTVFKILILVASLGLGGGIVYYTQQAQHQNQEYKISDYNADRDYQDMVKLFQEDWYWLSAREYDKEHLDFTINTGSPNEFEPRYFGKMHFNVMRDKHNNFIGFISFYMKNFHEGTVLYLAIRPEFRGKRYAEKLLDSACHELQKQGAHIVSLVTWVNNKQGNKLYPRYGFKEVRREGNYVYYEKPL
jgi:ribosomal protein S18 acetylase RimI-like enzyme